MMVVMRATDGPRTLRLLVVELAQEHHANPATIQVKDSGQPVDSEEKYRQSVIANSTFTIELLPGNVDHYAELKEAVRSDHFLEGLKGAAAAVCDGGQKSIEKLYLTDVTELDLVRSVIPYLRCLTRLRSFVLNFFVLTTLRLVELIEALPDSLEKLHIENIRMDEETLVTLSQRISTLRLQHLVLKSNVLESTGLSVLVPGLKTLSEVSYFMIEQNNLGSRGCMLLISLLPHLRELKFLEVRMNEFRERDLNELIRALSVVPLLRHLSINGNEDTEMTCRTATKYLSNLDMHKVGYYLMTRPEALQDQRSLKWGQMRNFVILREVLQKRAHF